MAVDASAVQQSVMSSTSQTSSNIARGSYTTVFDDLFPIADHISQAAHIPNSIVAIFQFWVFFQMIVVTFWVPMNPNLNNIKFSEETKYLTAAAFCFYKDGSQMSWLIPFLVYAFLFVLSLGILIFELLYYKSNRKFITWTLYPLRFLLEIIPLSVLHPIAALFGILVHESNGAILEIIAIVFLVIFYIYFAVLMGYTTSLLNGCAFLENHYFATFDVDVYRPMIIVSSLLAGAQYFIQYFPSWTVFFLVAIHIIILVYTAFHCMYFPYISPVPNVVNLAILMTTLILDILRVASHFTTNGLPEGMIQYITLALIVVTIAVSFAIFYFVTKKFKKRLMYNQYCNSIDDHGTAEHVTMTDDEKAERFISFNIVNHRLKTLFYLHLGIENMCDLFVDFSLIKWIGQLQPSTDILLDLVKFLILFPGEYRLTNIIVNNSTQRRNLTLANRNLLFQVFRIKILRQSSSSIQSSQKLAEMRNLNKSCESEILSFYTRTEVTLGLLMHINSLLSHTQSMWDEALKSFPNSPIHRDEHIRFLIECETNFDSAIVQAHRKELIETGYNFSVDYCFRSLAGTYPSYLKRKVLDLKGNFMKSAIRKGSQSQNSNSNNSNQMSYTSTSDMDQKMEEEIGKTIIKQSKIRLALQTATQGKKANNSTRLMNFNRAALLVTVVLFTVLFAIFYSYFDDRFSATERSMKCCLCRTKADLASLSLLLYWANETTPRRLLIDQAEKEWFQNESESIGVMQPDLNYSKNAIFFNVQSQEAYSDFLFDFATLARSGVNIFPMTVQLMENVIPQTFCTDGQPVAVQITNLRTTLVFNMMFQVMLASQDTDFDKWLTQNDYFCTIFSTITPIGNAFSDLRELLVKDQTDSALAVKKIMNVLSFAVPICYIFIVFAPYFTLTLLFNHEINHFVNLIMSVDQGHKNDATLPLMKNENEGTETQNAEEQPPIAFQVVIYLVLIFILCAGLMAFLVGIIISVEDLNTKFQYIGVWSFKSSSRQPFTLEALKSMYMSIFLEGVNTKVSNSSSELAEGKNYITRIEKFRDVLMQGDSEAPSILGFDETLTNMMIKSVCNPNNVDVQLHDMYVCGSVNQLTIFFKDLFNSAASIMGKFNGLINDPSTLNLYHLTLYHLVPRLIEVDDQFTILVLNFLKSYKDLLLIMYICALIVSVVLFIVGIAFNNILDGAYNAALVLLRRISPVGIIAKPKLVKYLLEISSEEKNAAMTISKSVFRNSQDGIFCIGLSGTIEVVNPAVSSILGYTPDQMLGQSIANVMDESDAQTVRTQLQLMVDRQSAPVYESHVVCVSDNDQKIECSLTVLGITETNGEISSFVAVIRDEHELVTQQEEAEKAKAQSENLLFQILPRGIVVRLNQGEKDISFSVPSSTICFIDIVKFSEYTVSMKPQEIMGTLSSLFGAYDEILTKYNLLLKIKLIGDVYMCAGGLFSPDEPPQSHAEQMIRFGLDALQQLEDTNIKMNTLLNVRIGVNTGGPLIAGVLGTDKPVFDIIGDPINISSRLQSTDIPGKIQISQATYELIKDMDFLIDQRGEVFLKGKGQSMAYLVSPHINTFQLSNCELSDSQAKSSQQQQQQTGSGASPGGI